MAIGLFIVLAVFQDRTEVEVPVPVLVASGGLVLVWFLEVLAPGMMMSALQSGLEEIGPLVWLVILAGGALSVIVWLRARGEPDEEVTLEIGDT